MIYLDNASTTQPKKEVVDVIDRCLLEGWGNPSSAHALGRRAKKVVDESRQTIADFIGADPTEIVFTSGACEANSLAIFGYMQGHRSRFYTSAIEHKSIHAINQYSYATVAGIIPANSFGQIDVPPIKITRTEQTSILDDPDQPFVSVQYANNEIGTIQNIKKIADFVHQCRGVIHTDATQMIPDRKIKVKKLGVDMLSFSGQKLGAPKGIGVLYVKNGIQLNPIIYGAQEGGVRGGTENVPYIAGLAEAIRQLEYPTGKERDYFVKRVLSEIEDCYLVGAPIGRNRLRNNAAICFKGVQSESILLMLDQKGIYVSSGSACNSSSLEPSHVLKAIGLPEEDLYSVVRFTFGENTIEEADIVVEELKGIVTMLRYMK